MAVSAAETGLPATCFTRKELAAVLLLYFAASVVCAYPLSLRMASEIPVGGDSWQNVWNLWWTEKAVTKPGLDLLWCPLIFHPGGLSLALHSNSYFNTFLSIPFQQFLSIEFLHYLLCWLYFPFSAFAAYLLARRYVVSPFAAFVAGWIYAFCPYRVGRYIIEQIDVLATGFIPLFILCYLIFLDKSTLKWAVLSALMLLFQLLSGWYNGAFCLLFAAFAFLYDWFAGTLPVRQPRFWLWQCAIVLAPLILLLPLIVPMARDLASPVFAEHQDQLEISLATSNDLLALITPGVLYPSFLEQTFGWHGPLPHSALKRAEEAILEGKGSNILENVAYLGWINLGILFCALWFVMTGKFSKQTRAHTIFWLVAFFCFLILSMGPVLQIAGKRTGIPLPYALVNLLPGLSVMRAPNRLTILVALSLGICVALVFDRWIRRGGKSLPGVLAMLIAIDLAVFPLSRLWEPIPISPEYSALSDDPTPGAVLEIPSGFVPEANWHNVRAMYFQTRHGRPLPTGYISRTPVDPYNLREKYPTIRAFALESLKDVPRLTDILPPERIRKDLEDLGIRYVVVHHMVLAHELPQDTAVEEILKRKLQSTLGAPVAEDEQIAVFRLE